MARPTLKKIITAYCQNHEIAIPPGFTRGSSASRYVVIRKDLEVSKLIARTWFNQEDIVYYIEHILKAEIRDVDSDIEILDFKDGRIMKLTAASKLMCDKVFELPTT